MRPPFIGARAGAHCRGGACSSGEGGAGSCPGGSRGGQASAPTATHCPCQLAIDVEGKGARGLWHGARPKAPPHGIPSVSDVGKCRLEQAAPQAPRRGAPWPQPSNGRDREVCNGHAGGVVAAVCLAGSNAPRLKVRANVIAKDVLRGPQDGCSGALQCSGGRGWLCHWATPNAPIGQVGSVGLVVNARFEPAAALPRWAVGAKPPRGCSGHVRDGSAEGAVAAVRLARFHAAILHVPPPQVIARRVHAGPQQRGIPARACCNGRARHAPRPNAPRVAWLQGQEAEGRAQRGRCGAAENAAGAPRSAPCPPPGNGGCRGAGGVGVKVAGNVGAAGSAAGCKASRLWVAYQVPRRGGRIRAKGEVEKAVAAAVEGPAPCHWQGRPAGIEGRGSAAWVIAHADVHQGGHTRCKGQRPCCPSPRHAIPACHVHKHPRAAAGQGHGAQGPAAAPRLPTLGVGNHGRRGGGKGASGHAQQRHEIPGVPQGVQPAIAAHERPVGRAGRPPGLGRRRGHPGDCFAVHPAPGRGGQHSGCVIGREVEPGIGGGARGGCKSVHCKCIVVASAIEAVLPEGCRRPPCARGRAVAHRGRGKVCVVAQQGSVLGEGGKGRGGAGRVLRGGQGEGKARARREGKVLPRGGHGEGIGATRHCARPHYPQRAKL